MNLRQLHYFYDVAQNQNLTKTAEKYMVPASSVSASIKRLEDELGVKLFDRSPNKIVLNEKGKLLANELHFAFTRIDYAIQQISAPEIEHPQIKILARARPKWITELITEYKAKNENYNFIISNDYALDNYDDFDIVIDEESPAYKNWERFLLSIEIICVKAASNSPLVNKELTFKQLEYVPFILPCTRNGMRNLYERICQKHGIEPNVAIECNDRQCLQHYVRSNMGLTLGAFRALKDNTQNGISPLKVLDFNEMQSVYVFYKASRKDNIYIKDFCDFLYSNRYI